MKRYFYITYLVSEQGAQRFVTATHIVDCHLIPTINDFINKLKSEKTHFNINKDASIIIISINEFNEEDFNNFIK